MNALSIAPETYADLVTVTPELAERWLGKNTRNRNVRQSKITTYADEMGSDDWLITGDGPKFDTSGRLINGQHTLMAVIAAGIPVTMFVFYGLHPDAQLVMDTGTKRSAADALKFAGIEGTNLNILAAVARIGVDWDAGAYKRAGRSNVGTEVTHTETLNWVKDNPDAVSSTAMSDQLRKTMPMPPSMLGFAHLLLSRVDADDADEFFLAASEMRTRGKGDPIFTMLRRYKLADDRGERLGTAQHLYFIIRSWNAFRDREDLHQLKVNSTGEGHGGAINIPVPK